MGSLLKIYVAIVLVDCVSTCLEEEGKSPKEQCDQPEREHGGGLAETSADEAV